MNDWAADFCLCDYLKSQIQISHNPIVWHQCCFQNVYDNYNLDDIKSIYIQHQYTKRVCGFHNENKAFIEQLQKLLIQRITEKVKHRSYVNIS